jgi:hypothetical protein
MPRAARHRAVRARELLDVRLEPEELIRDRARVALVREEQVEDRRDLQGALVAVPVGDDRVGDLEERFQRGAVVVRGRNEDAAEEPHRVVDALDPAPHVREAPAGAVRHVLTREAVQRCEEHHQLPEELEGIGLVKVGLAGGVAQ